MMLTGCPQNVILNKINPPESTWILNVFGMVWSKVSLSQLWKLFFLDTPRRLFLSLQVICIYYHDVLIRLVEVLEGILA